MDEASRPVKETRLRCFAVASPGFEPLVAQELATLGIAAVAKEGGVAWEGDVASVYRASLWLRTATRVLVRVARFRATSFWELEKRAAAVPWTSVLRPGATVAFRVTTKKSKLYHSDAVADRLAKAVVAAVPGVRVVTGGAATGDEEDDATPAATQLFVVRIARDELTLSADGSGEPLYRRGYRQAVAKAPLRETLAAGVLLASGWTPGDALLDPFCGSGTIPIEAALMAGNVAPGLASAGRQARRFAFESWPGFNRALWTRCIDDARTMARDVPLYSIGGSDRDEGAVAAARANAARAGVSEAVEFRAAPVSALVPPEGAPGWIVTNPPYGMRIGDEGDVRRLYAAFARAVRERASGWDVAMLSPEPRLDHVVAGELGVRLHERLRTRNGGIPVRVMSSVPGSGEAADELQV